MPSQCKVSKWWSNADQDEWFNLYLCLGSCWVNTNRDTRLDTILDTIPDTKSGTNLRSLDTKSSWNPDVWGLGLHLKPVPRSLIEEGSVRGRSLHHLPLPESQPDQFVVVNVTSHGRTTQFFQPNISVWVQVMKFLYFNIDSQTSLE